MTDDEKVTEYLRKRAVRDTELHCTICERITPHSISPNDCFCKVCGTTKNWRSTGIDPFSQFPFGS